MNLKNSLVVIILVFAVKITCTQIPTLRSKVYKSNIENGLPHNYFGPLMIDKNGYLIFSAEGISKFDGSNYIPLSRNRQLDSTNFFQINKIDSTKMLISGTNISMLFDSETELIDTLFETRKSDNNYLTYISKKKDNLYYIDSKTGQFYKYDLNERRLIKKPFEYNFSGITGFLHQNHDESSQLHISTSDTKEFKLLDFESAEIETYRFESEIQNSFTIAQKHYLFTKNELYIVNKRGESKKVNFPDGMVGIVKAQLSPYKDGMYLVALNERIFVFDPSKNSWPFELRNQYGEKILANNFVNAFHNDKFGNVYVHTNFSGIFRLQLSEKDFEFIGNLDLGTYAKEIAVNEKYNEILIGSNYHKVFHFDTLGILENTLSLEGENHISFILNIKKQQYLICGSQFCYEYNSKEKKLKKLKTKIPYSRYTYFSNVISDRDNEAIICLEDKIFKIRKGPELTIEIVPSKEWQSGRVRHDDVFWAWTNSNKITKIDNEENILYESKFDIIGKIKTAVSFQDSILLVGTTSGLFYLNTRSNNGHMVSGIKDCIYTILPYRDRLFCSTNFGLIELEDFKLKRRFTKNDGLQGNEFNSNVASIGESGKFYFGGINGVSIFKPDALGSKLSDHKTFLYPIKTNKNRLLVVKAGDLLELNHGENNIDFNLSTIGSKRSSDYNKQYYIENYSQNWTDAQKGSRINLTLSPGTYKIFYHSSPFFEAEAEKLEYFQVKIPEYWYQSDLFYILVMTTILLLGFFLIYLFYSNRYKIKSQNLKNKEELQIERNRISRELHDNIGIKMSIAGRTADWLQENIDSLSKEELKSGVQGFYSIAKEMNTDLRDTIWASKKESYTIEDIFIRVQAFVHKVRLNYPNLTVELQNEVNGEVPISPSRSLNLFRIIQEATHNTIRHAKSSKLYIAFKKPLDDDHDFLVLIKDNGIGFSQKEIIRGDGLDNLVDRSKESDFQLTIESQADKGTVVTCTVKK